MTSRVAKTTLHRAVDRLATPLGNPAESLVDPGYADSVRALLALTDRVARHRLGAAPILATGGDYTGNGQPYILGPFAYPCESRFSDGSFGVLYASLDIETAFAEVLYWLTRFFTDGAEPTGAIARKCHLTFRVHGELIDVRAKSGIIDAIYSPSDYAISRRKGAELRAMSGGGLRYDSVRRPGGECVGIFTPRIVRDVNVFALHEFVWDGARFASRKEVTPL
jgi:hypothetical protein